MTFKLDYEKLSKHLTKEVENLLKQTVIQAIFSFIHQEYLDITLLIFGGIPRDIVAGKQTECKDRDILIVGDLHDRNMVKAMINRKFRRFVKRSRNYFGNNQPANVLDVVEFQPNYDMRGKDQVFWYDIDFVFINDIPDQVLDFDINGLYMCFDNQTTTYSWKDMIVGSGRSNQKLKKLFQQIVEKKCTPTPYILSTDDTVPLNNSINRLYRFAKMMNNGYEIQYDEWQSRFVSEYKMIKEAVEWNESFMESYRARKFEPLSAKDGVKHDLIECSRSRINYIEYSLKNFCLNRMANISIALIPLNLTIYVQLWIMEFELPISNCIGEFDRVQCLENIRESRKKVMERRENPHRSRYYGDDDDDY